MGLFAGYVAAVAGLLVGVILIALARFHPPAFSALRGAATDLVSPVTNGGRAVVVAVTDSADEVAAYWNAGAQNATLRRELAASRARLVEARVLHYENARLKALAGLVAATPERVAVAQVVGSTASSARRLVTLSVGAASGVRRGQPVRSTEGLVGRVIETGRISARVLLVTDASSTVPALLVRTGLPVLATGHGDGRIDLRALAAGAAPFRRGDLIATSGTGGVYPPGIPIAVVTEAHRETAVGMPLADPARLDYAVVLRIFEPDLPSPAPAPRGP
ncbi:MAG TPA: rod shape-determining protein MreC [Sphingomonadaceae bacterium]|nr:rod shape-determining protein MreC [Sphingomonadaceae bacterium]